MNRIIGGSGYALILAVFAFLNLAAVAHAISPDIVISQVYGGGGNSGAVRSHDFIELFNRGSAPVNLNGWSVQYASATGTSWTNKTNLTNVTLAPGQYYLVQGASGGANGSPLPTADVVGSINLSGSVGKVALLSTTTTLGSIACPTGGDLVDFVAFGTTASNCFSMGVTPAPSNSNSVSRLAGGCTETDNNAADFVAGTPTPRNTASGLSPCGGASVLTPIYQIQGSGTTSPLVGQIVTTTGVVTRVNNNGFFLQDAVGDGNTATSDGIFVFTSSAPTVIAGQLIELSGNVAEFNTGAASNADTLAHPVTELTNPTGITLISSGNTITPVLVTLPEVVNDDLESYEGMLVTLNGPLTASQNFFQGRYGQVTLSVNGRLEIPTNKYRPNTPQAIALADANARSRILLDDGTSAQNPDPTPYIGLDNTLRAGDTVASVTGVIDYGLATNSNANFGDYKIHPTTAVNFTRANPRPAAPQDVGGNVKVASFNVLNFFTTFTDGNTAFGQSGQGCSLDGGVSAGNCRGANNAAEFARQRDKIIVAITTMDADVVGLMEIQNNGNIAVQHLVDSLNTATAPGTYAAVPLPVQGTGTDAIRVAMIYKPATVTLVGDSVSDTDAINDRPTLLQTFAATNGQKFSVVVNHFKSKGSCPSPGTDPFNENMGDGQGCWNDKRLLQAERLQTFIAANGVADTLIIGDLNAYAQEDPIFDLTSNGYVDQVGAFNSFGYSYVFDGAAGRLDHALSTTAMTNKITGVKAWQINADEPSIIDYNLEFKKPVCAACGPDYYTATSFRSSDHDPIIVGINLNDADGDGITDTNEAVLGTNLLDMDSDDDGIPDGQEDANQNGVVDPGETNPALADSDGDGIQDGTETGVTTGVADPDGAGPLLGTNLAIFIADLDPASTTLPLDADTDNDGLTDGTEDINHNGRVDAGESDPLYAPTGDEDIPILPVWAMLMFGGLLVMFQNKFMRRRVTP